ncbi:hypothetical protein TWF102_010750 [Orbilia oligospora]|uniref:Uncharacterized protein n=1 Tax=Orbilia oligospora TaxID=2813651 RepID=A0A7C8JBJ8_ORBOL|nr:hypothetical protein TWF102_010750 [Orbilia oligospora]KAF3111543.1 hypothetical protein TWF103_003490 [Orbilia oligospora]
MYRKALSASPALLKQMLYSPWPVCSQRHRLPFFISKRHITLLTPPLIDTCTEPIRGYERHQGLFVEYDNIKPGVITKYAHPIDVEPYIVGEHETDYRSIIISSLLIQEFEKANIRMTEYGTKIFQDTCNNFQAIDLYDYSRQYDFNSCLFDEIFNGPNDLLDEPPIVPDLMQLTKWPQPDKGRMNHISCRYRKFKIYLIWEALYYRSTYMRDVLEKAEIVEDHPIRGDRITISPLWLSLGLMYDMGLLVREDVDKLPDPIVYYKEFSKDKQA